MASETLTVIDDRTGRRYTLPITENTIAITEAKHVEKEYSPGFLNCRASIVPMSVNYRLDDGKLILSAPGTDESQALQRESPK